MSPLTYGYLSYNAHLINSWKQGQNTVKIERSIHLPAHVYHIWVQLQQNKHPSIIKQKKIFFWWKPAPPLFESWDMLRGYCYVVTTLKRKEGENMRTRDWRIHALYKKVSFGGASELVLSLIIACMQFAHYSFLFFCSIPSSLYSNYECN